jgi:hypothetical protein
LLSNTELDRTKEVLRLTTLTAEQVLSRNIEAMGADLGRIYTALVDELVWLHMKWSQYLALFGSSPRRVELLNVAAGTFFHVLQDVMWNDLLIGLARITDPPKSAGKSNLSVRCLPDLLKDVPIHEAVSSQVSLVLQNAAFARDWRNRHLAHRDLSRAIAGKAAEPLSSASISKIRECLSSMVALLNFVDNHYLDSTMFYDMDHVPGDAGSLLRTLDYGVRAKEAYFERLRSGAASSEDIEAHHRAV